MENQLVIYAQDEEELGLADQETGVNLDNELKDCLERIGQYNNIVFGVAIAILVQVLSGHKSKEDLDNPLLMKLWACILFFVFLSSCALMLYTSFISSKKQISHGKKKVLVSLTSFTCIVLMLANAVLLDTINTEYITLTIIPVLGSIIFITVFYFGWKNNHNEENKESKEYHESIIKNGFKLASIATSVGFAVQTTIIILGYSRNPNFHKDHPRFHLSVPYLTSTVGSFTMTLMSTLPLQFKRERMVVLVKYLRILVLFSLGLVALILAKEFLDGNVIILPMVIAVVVELIIKLNQDVSNEQMTESEIDPMFITVCTIGFTTLSTMYSFMFGNNGLYETYVVYSVFFILLAIISSLMRVALPIPDTETKSKGKGYNIMESVIYALPILEMIISFALILIEICKYV